jgi:hypothetical protein
MPTIHRMLSAELGVLSDELSGVNDGILKISFQSLVFPLFQDTADEIAPPVAKAEGSRYPQEKSSPLPRRLTGVGKRYK